LTAEISRDTLEAFLDAFNRHDLDAIMEYFAEECVFYMPRGSGPRGDKYEGKAQVRAGLAKRFEGLPDVHYGEDKHWTCGEFGVSEWTLTGTTLQGKKIRVRGVDLLEFEQGKIKRKDSFWKILD
jgi:steroid delta-isomerase-like uncharacterized protein